MTTGERPKAYSYVRFSTPEQAKGTSYDRQIEAAQAFARERGLELAETTYKDLGVSAHHNKNAKTGALRTFLEAVEKGDIQSGSYLLVENLDRISRDRAEEATGLFLQIIGTGIKLVTLGDGKTYAKGSVSHIDLIMSLVILMRGHEESATKSRRLVDAYERKRKAAAAGTETKPFTRMLPAWLQWSDGAHALSLRPERAEVIRSIFEKADAGWGQHRIAQWLNAQGTETWGGLKKQRKAEVWHRSYVKKLLTNSAVVGTFTPHQRLTDGNGKRHRKPLDPIPGYFPAVVDAELFERVTSRARAPGARGRNANAEPVSIFAGLLRCAHCQGVVTRVSKGEYVYLICSRANRKGTKGCRYQAVRYEDVEQAFRHNAVSIIREAPRGKDTAEIEDEISRLEEHLSATAEQAHDIADELVMQKSDVLRQRLADKEAGIERLRENIRELRARRMALAAPFVLNRLRALRDALRRKPLKVADVNKALKEAVSRIVIDPEAGQLAIYWHHSTEATDGGPFFSRHTEFYKTSPTFKAEKKSKKQVRAAE